MNPELMAFFQIPMVKVLLPFLVGLSVVTAFVLVRWLLGAAAWPHHVNGRNGYLLDEFVRLGLIFIPFLILAVIMRYYFFVLHPELMPYMMLIVAVFIVMRRFSDRIPMIREAKARIDEARTKVTELKGAA